MANHESKQCPRCNAPFECKVGSIRLCQCDALTLIDTEWDYIRPTYTDCLCRHCLQAIKREISTINTKQKMQAILAATKKKINLEERIKLSKTEFQSVFPNTTNHYDTLFGVTAMHRMDQVAFITATRFSSQVMLP